MAHSARRAATIAARLFACAPTSVLIALRHPGRAHMDRKAFEAKLRTDGYTDVVDREMPAGNVNPSHSHEFDARLLVVSGEMTLVREGGAETYRSGAIFEVPSGTVHEERAGPEGAHYIAGRRHR